MLRAAALKEINKLLEVPKAGTWARYKLSGETFLAASEAYVGVVKEELVGGKRHLWFEYTLYGDKDTTSIKALFPADTLLELKPVRVIVRTGSGPGIEIPAGLAGLGAAVGLKFGAGINPWELADSLDKGLKDKTRVIELDQPVLKISGRTVRTRHFLLVPDNGKAVEVWLSDDVPIFSLVKIDITKAQVEIVDWGYSGASTRIGDSFRTLDLKGLLKGLTR